MHVTIIGGERSLIEGNWKRRLQSHNIEVDAHFWDRSRSKHLQIPQSTQGIIVVRDMTRHSASDAAARVAEQRGLLYAAVPRKWSLAAPILQVHGFLSEEPQRAPVCTPTPPPPVTTEDDIVALADDYIRMMCNTHGTMPTKCEIHERLKFVRDSSIVFDARVYKKAMDLAQAKIVADFEDMQVRDWAIEMLKDYPTHMIGPDQDAKRHLSRLVGIGGPWVSTQMDEAMQEAKKAVREIWAGDEDLRHRNLLAWLKRWWSDWTEGREDLPRLSEIRRKSKAIFGTTPSRKEISDARAFALGEWARDLIEVGPAQIYLDKNFGLWQTNILRLLADGEVRGLEIKPEDSPRRGRWYTSEKALDEWISEKYNGLSKIKPSLPSTAAVEVSEVSDFLEKYDTPEVPKVPEVPQVPVVAPLPEPEQPVFTSHILDGDMKPLKPVIEEISDNLPDGTPYTYTSYTYFNPRGVKLKPKQEPEPEPRIRFRDRDLTKQNLILSKRNRDLQKRNRDLEEQVRNLLAIIEVSVKEEMEAPVVQPQRASFAEALEIVISGACERQCSISISPSPNRKP